MTATEVLRRLLDEHGVEYETYVEQPTGFEHVKWNFSEYGSADFNVEFGSPWLTMYGVISGPEQAIAATLGSSNCTDGERTETCKLDNFADVPFSVDYEIEGYDMGSGRDYATLAECSACGAYIIVPPEYHHVLTCDGDEVYQPYRYCPNCGRRVVQ